MAESTTPEDARSAGIRKAYGQATTALREKYPEEFKQLQIAAAKALGIEWSPRLSKDDREAQEVEAVLARRPDLREKLLDQAVVGTEQPDTKVEKGL